jgi:hypothetical protein
VGEDGEERGSRRPGLTRREFSADLRADTRYERAVFIRGVFITAGVVALVVVRGLLLP